MGLSEVGGDVYWYVPDVYWYVPVLCQYATVYCLPTNLSSDLYQLVKNYWCTFEETYWQVRGYLEVRGNIFPYLS